MHPAPRIEANTIEQRIVAYQILFQRTNQVLFEMGSTEPRLQHLQVKSAHLWCSMDYLVPLDADVSRCTPTSLQPTRRLLAAAQRRVQSTQIHKSLSPQSLAGYTASCT